MSTKLFEKNRGGGGVGILSVGRTQLAFYLEIPSIFIWPRLYIFIHLNIYTFIIRHFLVSLKFKVRRHNA